MQWLKFHQKIKNNEIMKDKSACHLLFWIFANVDEKGEVDFTKRTVALELEDKPSTVYDALLRLERLSIVSLKPTTERTLVKLSNWSKYQSIESSPTTNRPPTDHQPTTSGNARIYKTKTNTSYIQLTKNQKEKLVKEFPTLEVEFELEKFAAWQKANNKTFPNVLERFRLWLMDCKQKEKQTSSRSLQRPVSRVNPIIEDPLFQSYLKVYYPTDDTETRKKMALETQLSNKYSTFKYSSEWAEARQQIPKFN